MRTFIFYGNLIFYFLTSGFIQKMRVMDADSNFSGKVSIELNEREQLIR